MSIYDISVNISEDTPTYPGDPAIEVEVAAALSAGDVANVSRLHFSAHTGTHLDAPAHFIEGAPQVWTLPLDTLIGPARVVSVPEDVRAIDAAHLNTRDFGGATRVLFKTRNSAFWNVARGRVREDFTYITPGAARALVEAGVKLVGIDYLSVEKFDTTDFATHITLLSHGVVIVEGLDLSGVAEGTYELICLPLKIAGGLGDGAPARAILRDLSPPA